MTEASPTSPTSPTDPAGGTDETVERTPAGSRPLRTAVVYNPVRVQGLEHRRRVVDEALEAAGWPAALWVETTQDDPGAGQARSAAADGFDVVFACGGDGTVRSCVEGLVGGPAALAILPAGTGNLLATNLGIPEQPEAGVQLVLDGGRRSIDVGEVDGQVFAVMAGMGFDAAMLDDADSRLKSALGPVAYVLSALRHLRDRSMQLHIRLDDRPVMTRRARSVVVGNVGRLQAGLLLLPDAAPDDGRLDVALMAPRTLGHWVALAWGVVRRRRDVDHLELHRAARVEITSDRAHPRQLDGDVIDPGSRLVVSVRERSLTLCVPQPEVSPDLAEGGGELLSHTS